MFGHNTRRKHLRVMDFVIISHVGLGYNLIRLLMYSYQISAVLQLYLGSGKLDLEFISKPHIKSIVAFSKAIGLG
jgi:hypothetical protein